MVMSKGLACTSTPMGSKRRIRGALGMWLLLSPFVVAMVVVPSSVAAVGVEACGSDLAEPRWNATVERLALTPAMTGYYSPYNEMWFDEDVAVSSDSKDAGVGLDPSLHPEEDWMTAWGQGNRISPLTTSLTTLMGVGNDSAGVLRLNLSAEHRTTFCVSLTGVDAEGQVVPVNADVYLLTDAEFDRYRTSYQNAHGGGWWWDSGVGELLSERAPELRRYDPLGWTTYRDVHAYEGVDGVSFSLSLDRPEVRTSFVEGESWDSFHLVVDTWDNGHGADMEAPEAIVYADVAVAATPRSFIMPSATVALVMMAVLGALIAVPVVVQHRYANLGLDGQ